MFSRAKPVIFLLFLFFFQLSPAPCISEEIQETVQKILNSATIEELKILEIFIREMIEGSEVGYVLNDVKPVCGHGFSLVERVFPGHEAHRHSTIVREGIRVWKKLKFPNGKNYVFLIDDTPADFDENTYNFIFLSQKQFLDVVKTNLPLFQYVLGPDVTAESLLVEFMDTGKNFCSVLKHDKVLIGIILGFGTNNSLYGSRGEIIETTLYASETPPFLFNISHADTAKDDRSKWSLLGIDGKEVPKTTPGFGYPSLQEELKSLKKKMEVSSTKLFAELPRFVFRCLKDHEETKLLIKDLEEAQQKIQNLLSSKNILEEVMKIIYDDSNLTVDASFQTTPYPSLLNNSEIRDVPQVIVRNIWNRMEARSSEYIKAFIQGMTDSNNEAPPLTRDKIKSAYMKNWKLTRKKDLLKIRPVLNQTNDFFKKIAHDDRFQDLYKQKLYYRIIEHGHEEKVKGASKVFLHYKIFKPNDSVICDTWTDFAPHLVDLEKTIPGFAHGVEGMKIGEVREIVIHPDLAYGIYTTFDKAIYLRVITQLHKIHCSNPTKDFPHLVNSDLNIEREFEILDEENWEQIEQECGYVDGWQMWEHYKKGTYSYTLKDIVECVHKFQAGAIVDQRPIMESENILSKWNWMAYHSTWLADSNVH